tara:strand:+ start:47 stop:925 length:879 start_codon:yes stop_codon:yes gene_type:complete
VKKLAITITSVLILSACGGGDSSSPETITAPIVTQSPDTTSPINTQPTLGDTYTRVTTDQGDQPQSSNTVHILYAVPSGNEDKGRDKNHQLQTSILAANTWFNDISSGKQLKLDLQDNGDVDITFWPMTETNTELHQSDWFMRDTIEEKLKQMDWFNPDKLYVVYFEGSHQRSCGDASVNGGHMVGVYLHNATLNSAYDCSRNQFSANEDSHGYVEHVLIHGVVHALGVSHTSDTGEDLMYAGSEAWDPEYVDLNNDDYFMHGDINKVDILYSVFLIPNDGDELPPLWRNND